MGEKYLFPVILVISLVLAIAVSVLAGRSTDRIKKTTDKIMTILNDPALKAPDKAEERKKLIREAVDERFDWEDISTYLKPFF